MTYADYAAALATFGEQIKNDKDIVQPWRNYALKALNEVQAYTHIGLSTTNRKVEDLPVMQASCTCPEGGLRRDCPVHGKTA